MIEQASLVLGNGNWAVKSDSLLGYKINGGKYYPREMSVVRATSATRVNSEGLIEVVSLLGNELVTNGDFATDTSWSKSANTTISGGQATFAANGVTQSLIQANAWTADSLSGKKVQLTYTIISNSLNAGDFRIGGITGASAFNLTGLTASVGTYTVILDVRTSAGTDNAIDFYITSTATSGTLVIDNVSIKEVITNNIPRIDYSTGEPVLLVEPQRTNLLLRSQEFDNASWLKLRLNVSGTPPWVNIGVSPDGTLTSKKIIANTQNNLHSIYVGSTSTVTATTYTLSCFAKQSGVQYLLMFTNLDSSRRVNFDLANGVTSYIGANILSTNIEDYGNGWYRCSLTFTSTVNNFRLDIGLGTNTDFAFVGNDIDGVEIWGAQLEAGSYATSYIPTTSATVTRNQDLCSKTGISSLIGQTEGTLYFEGIAEYNTEICSINQSAQNAIFIYSAAGYGVMGYIYADGSNVSFSSLVNPLTKFKAAIAYKTNSMAMYINGNLIQEYTGFSFTPNVALTTLFIAQGAYVQGKEKVQADAIAIWKERLTNAELATLTTI